METKTHLITSHKEIKQLVRCCRQTGYCALDFETNAQPIYNKDFKPTLLSISFQPGMACEIPLDHPETKSRVQSDWRGWEKELVYFGHEIVEDYNVTKVTWNGKFDLQIYQLYHIYSRGYHLDGMLAKYVLDESRPNGLKDMVRRYLPEEGDYEKADKFDKLPWDQKPLDPLAHYGGQDADYTLRLSLFFEKRIIELNLYNLFRNLVMSSSRVLQTTEQNGLYLDRKFNKELLEEYKPKIDKARATCLNLPKVKKFTKWLNETRVNQYIESIQAEIEELSDDYDTNARKIKSREDKISRIEAGIFTTKKEQELVRGVNLNSNRDLPELMFGKHGFKMTPIKYTDKGVAATDEESLTKLRMQYPNPESPKAIFLDNLMELRGLEKMYKTYILGWSEKVQDDDCLHGRYNINGCVTGNTELIGKDKDIRIKTICPPQEGVKDVTKENIWILSSENTWEQVTHTINKGKHLAYKITTESGDTLNCTDHHKLLTPFGYKTVKEIYKKGLPIIMYDSSKYNITHPETGKPASEVIFKEIPNWPGYLVSNEGKVYSVKSHGGRNRSMILDYNHPHELIPREWKSGRKRVYFRKADGKKYAFSVSRLIWSVFNNSPIPKGMVVDHINCNSLDNRPENLQLITYSENTKRAYKYTRTSFTGGKRDGTCKLSTKDVGNIKYLLGKGRTQREIIDKFNISQKQVSGISLGERRKEIYLTYIKSMIPLGEKVIYDLSVNKYHSYITRSNFISSNTDSGRLSSKEPNMQQIPKVTVDPNIKKQLVARPGTLYLVSDFSQCELRFMAHLAKDKTYLDAFNNGKDPHLAIAAAKYNFPYEEAKKIKEDENHPDHELWVRRRKQAKQIAFGLIYGIGPALLAIKLSDPKAGIIVTKEQAQQEMDTFFKQHPRLKKFKAKQERFVEEHGYLVSLFGRKRRLPEIYGTKEEQAYAKRLGLNFPCQSAASDVTLFGSILIYWLMRQGKLPMMNEVATVHDAVYNNTITDYINIWTVYTMWSIYRDPDTQPYFGFHVDDVTMDMDFTIGRTMAEEYPFIPGYDYTKMLDPNWDEKEYMKLAHQVPCSIQDYPKYYAKEMEAYKESWVKYRDFKHVKKCGVIK